jgi:hypothetical protein
MLCIVIAVRYLSISDLKLGDEGSTVGSGRLVCDGVV